MRGTGSPLDPERLIREFELYDTNVDVVSAYQWLFTETKDLPATVAHFERYPKLAHPDGNEATPDFTVLFTDGTGFAAEIAKLALPEQSVDSLCKQLARYDRLTGLPNAGGQIVPVSVLDVVYLSPMQTADDAIRRIFLERLDNRAHAYSPSRRPVLIQFARLSDIYVFQFWPDKAVNGSLHVGGRMPNYASFESTLKISPERFASVKVQHAFMNDPISPLYLATRLWSNVFPSEFGGGKVEFTITASRVSATLREQYGHGTAHDVRRAMEILVAAELAVVKSQNEWRVSRKSLRAADDVHKVIAARVGEAVNRPPRESRRVRPRKSDVPPGQGSLFDAP